VSVKTEASVIIMVTKISICLTSLDAWQFNQNFYLLDILGSLAISARRRYGEGAGGGRRGGSGYVLRSLVTQNIRTGIFLKLEMF
jgi:hypothetical protein